MTPILVLNKMDRLVTELKLSPNEAYHHLNQLIEQVNAVMGSFFASERMDDDLRWHEEREKRLSDKKQAKDSSTAEKINEASIEGEEEQEQESYEELDDEDIYFDPARGNVIFASAIDNWAFRPDRFSHLYAKKLGIEESKFRKVLWGDFYFDPKSKRILTLKQKEKEGRNLKPVFVQFVLENIWSVYDSAQNRDQEKIEKIVKALELKILPRDLKSKDSSSLLQSIFSQWLPLASCTFGALVSNAPSPATAQRRRIPKLLHPELHFFDDSQPANAMEQDLFAANTSSSAWRCAYISKMFAVARSDLPEGRRRELSAEEMRERGREARERAQAMQSATGVALDANGSSAEGVGNLGTKAANGDSRQDELSDEEKAQEVILGFARLYSGTISVGHSLYALLPKYRADLAPSHPSNIKHIRKVTVEGLYMMLGRDLVAVNEVPAGNVFAVRGLDGSVLRNATLCGHPLDQGEVELDQGRPQFVNLAGINSLSAPIVRVALEPRNPSDMPKLVEGLRLLNQADPCVETIVQSTGEHVIACAGELHLERCLRDLKERFARCAIQSSQPLVPYRETAVKGAEMPPPKTEGAARGTVRSSLLNELVTFSVRAVPLPSEVASFLEDNTATIRKIHQGTHRHQTQSSTSITVEDGTAEEVDGDQQTAAASAASKELQPEVFWSRLETMLEKSGPTWRGVVDRIWSFGPRRVGPNFLVDARSESTVRSLRRHAAEARGLSQGINTPSLAAENGTANAEKGDHEDSHLAEALEKAMKLEREDKENASKNNSANWQSKEFEDAFDTGFQFASLQGPMCAEPMHGMAFFVESVDVSKEELEREGNRLKLTQVTSGIITSMREACKNGLLDWSPRLMLAMYSCDIQASTDVLGKVHAVLSRRRGHITSEEMKDGTSFFTVGSVLPVVESFGFADEIRKRTSGAASPQLVFAGFEIFDIDPFWVPRTEEELEDLGEKGDRENVAKRYMDKVRKRKGLFVNKRIVEGEKQRTLKSN